MNFLKRQPTLFCPSCEHRLEPGLTSCDLCGFHLGKLDAMYGTEEVVMDQLTDASHRLRQAEQEAIWEVVDTFERQFPQYFPAFYIGDLQRDARLCEFAAWMLNRVRVDVKGDLRNGANAFLVVIDLAGRQATISPGYAAEPYIDEEDLWHILEEAKEPLAASRLVDALRLIVDGMGRALKRSHRTLSKTGSLRSSKKSSEADDAARDDQSAF